MLGIIELKRKYERVKREIEGKRKLLHTSNVFLIIYTRKLLKHKLGEKYENRNKY